tara:strand:- start:955 stop:1155 length:201 start_codon:yes stop_codon:yes gene_type:complete
MGKSSKNPTKASRKALNKAKALGKTVEIEWEKISLASPKPPSNWDPLKADYSLLATNFDQDKISFN